MDNSYFNSTGIIAAVFRWKKHLIIVGIISLLASVIFSSPWFIKPKFKSFALVYPSNLIAYSNESATEQMLQFAQSSEIRNWVIRSFDLYSHYKIDTANNPQYKSDVIKMYDEHVNIRKTEYETMEITVLDSDPLIASRMTDSIIRYFDVIVRKLHSEKSQEVMVITKNQMDQKKNQMDSMENRLNELRAQYGLLEYKEQTREVTRAYLRGLRTGDNRSVKESKELMTALQEKGGEFNSLQELLWRIRGDYNELQLEYENAEKDVYKNLTYANVVTRPQPADKKSFPVRWLIVVISVGTSLLVAFMTLLIFYSKDKIKV